MNATPPMANLSMNGNRCLSMIHPSVLIQIGNRQYPMTQILWNILTYAPNNLQLIVMSRLPIATTRNTTPNT